LVFAQQSTGCRPLPMLRGLVGPAISSLVAAGGCLLVLRLLSSSPGSTLLSLAIGLAIFTACMFLIDRKSLVDDWSIMRRIMSGHGPTTEAAIGPN
jgi:hypothetical protein